MFNIFKRRENKFVSTETFRIIEMTDRGDPNAKRELSYLMDRGLTDDEINRFRRMIYFDLSQKNDPFGQYWMGFIASVMDRNASLALDWYIKAAKNGSLDAMKALSFGYSEYINETDLGYGPVGFGYDKTSEKFWMRKAAEQGDAEAQYKLADIFYYDDDAENAIYWYSSALLSDDVEILIKANSGLANIYGTSWKFDGKFYNEKKQKEFLLKLLSIINDTIIYGIPCADSEYEKAVFALGTIFEKEFKSNEENSSLMNAAYCYYISAKRGNSIAENALNKLPYSIPSTLRDKWSKDAGNMKFHF